MGLWATDLCDVRVYSLVPIVQTIRFFTHGGLMQKVKIVDANNDTHPNASVTCEEKSA